MAKNTFQIIKDGFINVIKGLGTSKDAKTQTTFGRGFRINQQLANDLYAFNWLAGKVIDCPVDDATRKWRSFKIEDEAEKEEIENVMKAHDVKSKINQAAKWERVFGGAAILVVIAGDDQETPLDLENIKEGSLSNLIVLDKYNIYNHEPERDILSPNFGQPEFYSITRTGQKIHHSRFVLFKGWIPTIQEWERENFWGISLFNKLWDPISSSQTVSGAISSLVYEANIDVYKIKGLNDMVAGDNDSLAIKRIELAHQMKSVVNGIVLDSEDEYDKKSNVFASLDNIDDRFIQKVSGASGIPVTKLVGISPAGQNATGESDMRNYYDDVSSFQENILRPRIDILDTIIIASEFGKRDIPEYEFLPLEQMNEEQKSKITKSNAETDQIYLTEQVIEPADVMARLAQEKTYPTIDAERIEEEKKKEDLEYSEAEEEAGESPGE